MAEEKEKTLEVEIWDGKGSVQRIRVTGELPPLHIHINGDDFERLIRDIVKRLIRSGDLRF